MILSSIFSAEYALSQNYTILPTVDFSSSQTLDSAAPSLRSTNLSALKKRWEQAGSRDQAKLLSVPPPGQTSARSRSAPLAQRGQLAANQDHAASRSGECGDMDRDEVTQSERPEMAKEQVPTSPRASEKPRVPLNNLKMKFERGEDATAKVATDRFTKRRRPP